MNFFKEFGISVIYTKNQPLPRRSLIVNLRVGTDSFENSHIIKKL